MCRLLDPLEQVRLFILLCMHDILSPRTSHIFKTEESSASQEINWWINGAKTPESHILCSVSAKQALDECPPSKKYKDRDNRLDSLDDIISNISNHQYHVEILSKVAKSQYAIFGQHVNDSLSTYRHTDRSDSPRLQKPNNRQFPQSYLLWLVWLDRKQWNE